MPEGLRTGLLPTADSLILEELSQASGLATGLPSDFDFKFSNISNCFHVFARSFYYSSPNRESVTAHGLKSTELNSPGPSVDLRLKESVSQVSVSRERKTDTSTPFFPS